MCVCVCVCVCVSGAWRVARGAWRVARGAWRVARGAWRVARGAWRVAWRGVCNTYKCSVKHYSLLLVIDLSNVKFPVKYYFAGNLAFDKSISTKHSFLCQTLSKVYVLNAIFTRIIHNPPF